LRNSKGERPFAKRKAPTEEDLRKSINVLLVSRKMVQGWAPFLKGQREGFAREKKAERSQ